MIIEKNIVIHGKTEKPIIADVFFDQTYVPKPILIFCHGYKGFKDWGAWNLMARAFAANGFFFIKFNFSHNGGTLENPMDFPDLEAFAEDNYSIQLDDLETVIDWIITTKRYVGDANVMKLNLIGHSRGGGIVLLKAARNKTVKKVVTFAAVADFAERFPKGKALDDWRKKGIYYVENNRTHQQMPHHFQFYKDFEAHKQDLGIKKAVRQLRVPQLIVHAKNDTSVSPDDALKLHGWNPKSTHFFVERGGHTFGAKHLWEAEAMPDPLAKIVDETVMFLKSH